MQVLDLLFSKISRVFGIVAAASVAAIMIAIVCDVTSRTATGRSIPGVYELVETLVVVVAFMGLAYTERSGSSVRVTLLTDRLPRGVARYVRALGTLCASIAAAWIAYSCWGNAFSSFERGEVRQGLVAFQLWPARCLAALGMSLAALEFLMTSLRIVSKREDHETHVIPHEAETDIGVAAQQLERSGQ